MEVSDFPNVWKVFSQSPLSKKELGQIFTEINSTKSQDEVYVADWLAYPEYEIPQKEAKSARFRYTFVLNFPMIESYKGQ